ncbi:hypothetical protein GmHk_09G025330 [Glycine max]|nr:hypothetical protein GmHk_09G025330 [Glycine max]
MGQLQRQAFRKAYGKIWDLAMIEVSIEAIASLAQYYDQPLRCFTFGDFQLSPMVEEFEEILGCPLGGRKPYLFTGFYPSLARISKMVQISAQELDHRKQVENGVVGIPRKYLEVKARILADKGEWVPFIDILALLIFGGVLFPNVDGLVDLAAIDAFLAYHNHKESPVVAMLADLYDTFDRRCEKSNTRIVCCTPTLYEGRTGVLISCGGFPNVPLVGTRGCISYNRVLAIRQLGYPMRGAPLKEEIVPVISRGFKTNVRKAWEVLQKKDKELRGSNNGPIGGYHEWLKAHVQGLDWLPGLRTTKREEDEAPEEDEEVQALRTELKQVQTVKERFKSAALKIRKENAKLRDVNIATTKALEQETKRARREEHGRNKFRGALWGSNSELKHRREERDQLRVDGLISKEELKACSRSKRSLSQRLCETKTNMLAIITKYQEELNLATAHEHRVADEYAQVYAEKEARGMVIDSLHQEATMWMDRFAFTLNGSQELPRLLAKAKAMANIYSAPEEIHGLLSYSDMSALKEQMASMMEAMLGMRQLMEKNVATAAAVSSAAEADPTLLATAHHPPPNKLGRGRNTLGHNNNPHLGYNRATYPYGLPPNYSPPVMQDDAGHISSPILEGEPPQQPEEVHEDPQNYARRDVEFYPPIPEGPAPNTLPQPNLMAQPIPKAPIQREAPQVPTPTTTRPAGNSNAMRNFPPMPIQEFTPLPMTYEDLLPSLIANQLAVITPGKVFQPPFPKWYDPNATCKYHGNTPGHSIEKCLALKYKVQHLIDAGWLPFQEDRPNVKTNPLANHGGGAVNAIRSDRPRRSKPLKDVATPRRFIFEALQKGGVIPHGGHKEDSCLLHSDELHNMETCLEVEELLQQMIDQGRLEVDSEGREEQHICMQSTEESSLAKPKPLVIYFTKGAASQKPRHPLAPKHIPFPYQNSHAVPWKYTPPNKEEEETTDISSLSAKVTNITGLSGVTRSGRVFAPPDLQIQPTNVKGKAKVVEEQDDKTPHTPNEDIPAKGLPEKRDGYGKKEGLTVGITHELETSSGFACKVMMARVMLGSGYEPRMGLGKENGSITSLINAKGNRGKYGLGYKPTQADIKRSIVERKSGSQGSRLRQEGEESPPCHISRSFISVGLGDEGQVIAIYKDDVPSALNLVRPCPPDFRLGNWQVEERPDIYATSIMKLASKRSRKDKGWSFLRERRVQLRDDEYTDFQEEIVRRWWASLVTPMAKFDPDIVLEFYVNAWPTEEGVRDMRSWVRGQWIPFNADALNQFLGYPLVLEEGQECEYGMPPTRHPLDPNKSNKALGFPALITGLCQSFGVPVAPSKVIRPPITRAFIEKYCTQRQAQGGDPQALDAPPPPPQADPAGSFDTEQYLRHLVRQQAANHRAHSKGFVSFPCPTPNQFRAEVSWLGDWPEAQAAEASAEAPGEPDEAREDEEMSALSQKS